MSSVNGTDEDAEAAKRRTNPLIDLIESEKRYVDELGMVIRVRRSLQGGPQEDEGPSLVQREVRGADQVRTSPFASLSSLRPFRRAEGSRSMVSSELSAAAARLDVPVHRGRLQDQPGVRLGAWPLLLLGRVDIADLEMHFHSNLQKLKEIGPNPSSPKALGDLLMRWVCRPSRPLFLPSRR